MGKWKKAVAALAAVPMLMALAPAANAVESDPTDSSAAQRALAAALKSNAKAAADSDLLASLDFDNVAAGATGTIVDDTTGTKATSTVLPQWLPARTALLQFGSVLDSG